MTADMNTPGPTARILLVLALAALVAGCGGSDPPVASSEEGLLPVPAAKPPNGDCGTEPGTSSDGTGRPLYAECVSGPFSPDESGSLTVKFANNYGDWDDLRLSRADFEVEAGALDAAHEITMTVTTGYVLEDLMVVFEPDGLTFTPPAILTLTIWWGCESCRSDEQLAILEALAQHIHPDGTVTESTFETSQQGNAYLIVTIEVPGFSSYGLRD